ncbi:MAG: TIGR03084 family metal-binding protein [Sciscionella sp.]
MAELAPVLADLAAESAELDALVVQLSEQQWRTETPAEGWSIANQIAHLHWTDRMALLSATDPEGFTELVSRHSADPLRFVEDGAKLGAVGTGELLGGWRRERAALAEALLGNPACRKLSWFGPPMSVTSMATARIMETWAHGQDVADALGVIRTPTARLKNVAHLAVRTRDFAYILNGQTPPAEEFRVELTAPAGESWAWGPQDARQRVTGPALDFCLLATRRRHRDDLALRSVGAHAAQWLTIAQAFAGPPGNGRLPGQFA